MSSPFCARCGALLATLFLAIGLHAGDAAADFDAKKTALDAATVAYKDSMIDAYVVGYGKYMEFLAGLDMNDVSTQVPADPRASDLQRRDKARVLNTYFATLRLKVEEWQQANADPRALVMFKKSLGSVDSLPLDITRSLRLLPDFFTLYKELKVTDPAPAAAPPAEPGVIDDAPWRQKK
jgi:hypothetical protein